jgi:hypothetical protein
VIDSITHDLANKIACALSNVEFGIAELDKCGDVPMAFRDMYPALKDTKTELLLACASLKELKEAIAHKCTNCKI